jgi:spore coat polysaccharide biosynthesis protein SpsF
VKTLIIIQARMGSSRLPGKILMPLAGAPLLQRMVERVKGASGPYMVLVATTTDPEDDPVRFLCEKMRVPCFLGHPTDLLDRHYQAARMARAEVVVKIPSDCPLIDPAVIDRVIGYFLASPDRIDYTSNLHPATYPDGNDVEVMSFKALERAWKEADKLYEREHTTPFLWERPERFALGNITWETGMNLSMSHRWTIDYHEDYEFICKVYEELWVPERPIFTIHDILTLLRARPDIAAINARYAGVNWYRHHLSELKTITDSETRQEPARQA